ncbi:hypothetical protein BA899_01045 [Spiribacter sp. SSL99]|nr:hypothetical protein BA899_01045 [Spiribacter sp. SSL99]
MMAEVSTYDLSAMWGSVWIEQTEGAKFWMRIMNELRARGTNDILIAVVDGLKGFPEAITSAFPDCVVQTCIVHLIRHSMQFASWKERKALAQALRPIFAAPSADAAEQALADFEQGPWGGSTRRLRQAGSGAGLRSSRSSPSRLRCAGSSTPPMPSSR